jgi:hypothetical protein
MSLGRKIYKKLTKEYELPEFLFRISRGNPLV